MRKRGRRTGQRKKVVSKKNKVKMNVKKSSLNAILRLQLREN